MVQPKPRWWMETPDGHQRPSTLEEAAPLMGTASARVAEDEEGDVRVSTVYLFLDHDHGAGTDKSLNLLPMTYESMVFGGEHDGEQRRYRSREDALTGHAEMCREFLGRPPANA